jgi:branched-chain amino acid transport system permease protein
MVIGGSASILGTILGAVYFVLLPVAAGQIDSSRTALISGAVLLAVLFLLPGGLVSLPRRIVQLTSRAKRGGRTPANQTPTGGPAPSGTAPGTTAPGSTAESAAQKQPK